MSESVIDWNLAPEGAFKLVLDGVEPYFESISGCKMLNGGITDGISKVIATRPTQPRKTVKDAVDWHIQYFGDTDWHMPNFNCIVFNTVEGFAFGLASNSRAHSGYITCTREDFEQEVARQKQKSEPYWTHKYLGRNCRVLINKPDSCDFIVIHVDKESGAEYEAAHKNEVLPIPEKKPISKADAWDMLTKVNGKYQDETVINAAMQILQDFIITDKD